MYQFRQLRKTRKISQVLLAKKLGVSQTAISQWENGRTEPEYSLLIKLADVYNVSIDYILGRTPIPEIATEKPRDILTDFERKLLSAFRSLPAAEQIVVCRSIGIDHPAARRAEIKQA